VTYRAVPAAGRLVADRHRASRAFAELITAEANGLGVRVPARGDLLALALTGAVAEVLGWWAPCDPAPRSSPSSTS
jgi:hypothetical protein